ncbi:MAG TPA: SurA N-terminal domain-containing protein [Geobacteraceae bacterium]
MHSRCKSKLLLIIIVYLMLLPAGRALSEESKDLPQKAATPAKASSDSPVVRVNGTAITRAELDRAARVIKAQSPAGSKLTENDILDELISTELLYQAGSKLPIRDLDKQVEERMARNRAQYPDSAAFESALKAAGLTPKELEELARKDIVIKRLVDKEIAPKVSVSKTEARKFYDENRERFKQGEKEAVIAKFEEVEGKIQDYLKRAKIRKALGDYVGKLREQAKIERMDTK